MPPYTTATDFRADLLARATAAQRRAYTRYFPGDDTLAGVRMGDVFTLAKGALDLPVDQSVLDELRHLGDGDEFVATLVRDFVDDAEILLNDVETAVENSDVTAFDDAVHTLRSAAANVGAAAVFKLCLSWRNIGLSQLKAEGPSYITQLRAEFARVRDAFGPYLETERREPEARA